MKWMKKKRLSSNTLGEVVVQPSAKQLVFLRKLETGGWNLANAKASTGIQSLIDRGYCRTSPERIGPLQIRTGEICIWLSEAGKLALHNNAVRVK